MEESSAKKLYRGIIIALIAAIVPLFLLGSVQLIFGIKITKDNAKAIQEIRETYMRTDLFERWILLLEEKAKTVKSECEKSNKSVEELEKEIDYIYGQMKIQSFGRTRGSDTTSVTFNGIF